MVVQETAGDGSHRSALEATGKREEKKRKRQDKKVCPLRMILLATEHPLLYSKREDVDGPMS